MSQTMQLQEAFKLALSMMLFYWLALYMDWDLPKFGALAIVIISLSTTGASINKGIMRVVGTGIGALAGFVLLSWFSQSPLGMPLATAAYLVFVGYFLQTARQGDIWFNAGFLPVAVWSSSYMQVDTAFHIATSRFLETAAGVLIFSIVAALLWPRTSGASLPAQGRALWTGLQGLFEDYRRALSTGQAPREASALRTRLAGEYQQMSATLQAAYVDTPPVGANQGAWEELRVGLRSFANAQELWRESIDDCRDLDLEDLLPGLESALDTLERRLQRGRALWQEPQNGAADHQPDDAALLAPLDLQVDRCRLQGLPHLQQAALMNLLAQLHALDDASRTLLRTLRVLAGLAPASSVRKRTLIADPFQPSAWNPERLLKALFPAICWGLGYACWFHVDPPGGPAVAMMSAAFGLMMVMAPTNLVGLLIVLVVSMFVAVAPVYLIVMPALDSGFALLALIFVYAFVFAYLGGFSPILKLGPLAMFVMLVNINNQQSYSFIAMVAAALVILLGVAMVTIAHRLLSPMHPEKVLVRSVRRFLAGSARIIEEMRPRTSREHARGRRLRRRLFESAIQPVSAQISTIERELDYGLFPDNTPDKVRRLMDNLQSVRLRLQSLEAIYTQAASHDPALMRILEPFNERWRRRTRRWLASWSRLGRTPAPEAPRLPWSALVQDLEHMLRTLQETQGPETLEGQGLRKVYAFVGAIRSLLGAMQALGDSLAQINWNQWTAARF